MIGGVAASGGDLFFAGELTGDFHVFDARNGHILYTHNVGGPPAGGTVTYEVEGHQDVAVVSGYMGVYNTIAPEIGGANPTVTVFAVNR
jgi:alcohol dehydrogenase (cytochrome c)